MLLLKRTLCLALLAACAAGSGAPGPAPAVTPVVPAPPVTVPPPVVAPPPVPAPPPLPPAAVVLARTAAADWLNAAGIPATVVSERTLPAALESAVLVVVPAQDVRDAATVDALKRHTERGGRVIAAYWGPVGTRGAASDALAALLGIRVTGWSGKGNGAIVPTANARGYFGGVPRLKTGRPFAVVAVPVVPPAPKPAVNAPRPVQVPGPPKPNTGGASKPAVNVPAAPVVPPPPPPPTAVGRWVGDDGKSPRRAPEDAAVIAAPATLWIGEDVFLPENDTQEMRRWFASAAVTLAPTLRLTAKQSLISAATARLDAIRARLAGLDPAATHLAVSDAQRAADAAARSLAAAAADMDFAAVQTDVAAASQALLDADAALTPSRPAEVRAAWIPRRDIGASLTDVRRVVQRLADAKFNVLLPEVVYEGSAAFPSGVYPQDPRFAGFDPLRALVDEAHRRGVEVHPWVWTLAAGANGVQGPLLKSHPEWAMRDIAGRAMTDSGMFWMSPSVPAARTAIRNVVREIAARYDVDGIHLDTLRYPDAHHDYADPARAAFRAQGGPDPLDIVPPGDAATRWHAWREEQVNSLVREIHTDIDAVKPGLPFGSSVYSSPVDSRRARLQDWENWTANHWVDWVAPVASIQDGEGLATWLNANQAAAADRAFLVPGLSVGRFSDAAGLNARLSAVRTGAAQGVAFRSASSLSDDHLRALKLGAFRRPAVTPWKNPLLAARNLAAAAAETLRGTPVADAAAANTVRAAIAELDAWAAGSTLDGFTQPPPSLAAMEAMGDGFAAPLSMVRQAVQLARVETVAVRAANPPVPPSAPPLPAVPHPQALPSARVPVAMGAVTVDGRLDEAAWNGAATLALERTHEGDPAPVGTTVRLIRDSGTLYVSFTCPEPNLASLRAVQTLDGDRLWEDDSVEVFLSPSEKGLPYMHFAVGAGGGTSDGRSGDARWGTRWTAAVTRSEAGWFAEIGIPFQSLGGSPAGAWRANFARNRMPDGPSYLTWSVPYGSYHTVERFGRLAF